MNHNSKYIIADFVRYCARELNIEKLPHVKLIADKTWVETYRSFGEYNPEDYTVKVYYLNRNTADVLRSLAHELVHHRQEELGMIEAMSGETGSEIENEANAMAGILLRDYGKDHIEIYDLDSSSLNETIKIGLYPGKKGVDVDASDKDIENAPKVQIPLSKLVRNERAIKMKSPESIKNIKALASVYSKGRKMDPILVRKKGDKFQILDGHHRYTAAKLAGLKDINAIIVPDKDITPVDDNGSPLNEVGEDLSSAYDFKYVGGSNPTYTFSTGETEYKVVFRDEEGGTYERMYMPVQKKPLGKGETTGEGKAIPVNATVMAITLDFLENNKDWHTVTMHPIDPRRHRLVTSFVNNNIPKNKYDVEDIDGILNITRKIR